MDQQPAPVAVPDKPRLAPGIRLAGEMRESAFVKPPWLIEREGQGYIQVPKPLYEVAEQADGERTVGEIAEEVAENEGVNFSEDNIRQLIATQLIPNGVMPTSDGKVVPRPPTARSALAIARMKTIDAAALAGITRVFQVVFWPPVLAVTLGIAMVTQVWLYAVHGVGGSLHDAFYVPGFMLIMLVAVLTSAGFHELGHAAALRYGGGTPRTFGFGMYLMYPVFFTDVSDNYRLRRWGRVRTDLAGFYFNLIYGLGVFALYVLTRQEALLVVIVVMNVDIIRQLLPFVRLDGYWTLADLTGIPDFLSKMGTFVRSNLPWLSRESRPTMAALKWWARAVFAVYVIVTIPALVILLVVMVRSVPRVIATAWDALGQQGQSFLQAQASFDVLGMAGAAAQSLLIALPVAGLVYSLVRIGRGTGTWAWRWSADSRRRRAGVIAAGVAIAGLVAWWWMPQWPFQPIGEGERLNVSDALQGVVVERPPEAELPTWLPSLGGHPAVRSAMSPPSAPPPPSAPAPGPGAQPISQLAGPAPAGPPASSSGGAAPPPGQVSPPNASAEVAPPVVGADSPPPSDVGNDVPPVADTGVAQDAVPAVVATAATVPNNVVPTAVPAVVATAATVPNNVVPTAVSVAVDAPHVTTSNVSNAAAPAATAVQPVATAVEPVATVVATAVQPLATALPAEVDLTPTVVTPAETAVATAVRPVATAVATDVQPVATAVATEVQPIATAVEPVVTVVATEAQPVATAVATAAQPVATVIPGLP